MLSGTIDVRGSKNAALPIIAASILTKERCRISNIPLVSDVYQMIDILSKMGASVVWAGERSVDITNKKIDPRALDSLVVKKMRASILLLGPILARFGKVEKMRYPGGCSIGRRPIDTHLEAFRDLGARVSAGNDFFSVEMPRGAEFPQAVVLSEFSVTATENMLTFLSSFPGSCQIKIAASEPHVVDLAKFLSKMGANIKGAGTSSIKIQGASCMRGATHKITPDYIEAGTFILAALAVGGSVRIKNIPISDLDFVIKKLVSSGANIKVFPQKSIVEVFAKFPGAGINGRRMKMGSIQTLPHPGIPTDLQPVFCVLATQTQGKTFIHEPLYEKRLSCIKELNKMNAKTKVHDPHRATIWGPGKLRGCEVAGYDLRGGTALVVAGLVARGTTTVLNAKHVERGYEDIAGRLRLLGADINKL